MVVLIFNISGVISSCPGAECFKWYTILSISSVETGERYKVWTFLSLKNASGSTLFGNYFFAKLGPIPKKKSLFFSQITNIYEVTVPSLSLKIFWICLFLLRLNIDFIIAHVFSYCPFFQKICIKGTFLFVVFLVCFYKPCIVGHYMKTALECSSCTIHSMFWWPFLVHHKARVFYCYI